MPTCVCVCRLLRAGVDERLVRSAQPQEAPGEVPEGWYRNADAGGPVAPLRSRQRQRARPISGHHGRGVSSGGAWAATWEGSLALPGCLVYIRARKSDTRETSCLSSPPSLPSPPLLPFSQKKQTYFAFSSVAGFSFSYAQEPLRGAASGALKSLGEALKGLPSLNVPLPENIPTGSQAWILTTYLDASLRIARGDGGSVFVLTKVSSHPSA